MVFFGTVILYIKHLPHRCDENLESSLLPMTTAISLQAFATASALHGIPVSPRLSIERIIESLAYSFNFMNFCFLTFHHLVFDVLTQ